MRLVVETYVSLALGSVSITAAGIIRAVTDGAHFNAPLAFAMLGVLASVGFWLMTLDVSSTE